MLSSKNYHILLLKNKVTQNELPFYTLNAKKLF